MILQRPISVLLASLLILINASIASADMRINLTRWGAEGSAQGEFSYPHSVVLDKVGNVYVADAGNHRIQKFDNDGDFLTEWGSEGEGPGQFVDPVSLAVDEHGDILVVDSGNSRIQKFSSSGRFIAEWGGKYGSSPGQLVLPNSIAIDKAGYIFVADAGEGVISSPSDLRRFRFHMGYRIQKFTATGQYICEWREQWTEVGAPKAGTLTLSIDSHGTLFVADTRKDYIRKFNKNLTPIGRLGSRGAGRGQFSDPYGIATDRNDNIWVADSGNDRIQIFDSKGVYSAQMGSKGSGDGEFNFPFGIAVSGQGDLYVADRVNHRIQKFSRRSARADSSDVAKPNTFRNFLIALIIIGTLGAIIIKRLSRRANNQG